MARGSTKIHSLQDRLKERDFPFTETKTKHTPRVTLASYVPSAYHVKQILKNTVQRSHDTMRLHYNDQSVNAVQGNNYL